MTSGWITRSAGGVLGGALNGSLSATSKKDQEMIVLGRLPLKISEPVA